MPHWPTPVVEALDVVSRFFPTRPIAAAAEEAG
jgi:hypothetical protein